MVSFQRGLIPWLSRWIQVSFHFPVVVPLSIWCNGPIGTLKNHVADPAHVLEFPSGPVFCHPTQLVVDIPSSGEFVSYKRACVPWSKHGVWVDGHPSILLQNPCFLTMACGFLHTNSIHWLMILFTSHAFFAVQSGPPCHKSGIASNSNASWAKESDDRSSTIGVRLENIRIFIIYMDVPG